MGSNCISWRGVPALIIILIFNLNRVDATTLATYGRDGLPFPFALELQKQARATFPTGLDLIATAGGVDNIRAIQQGRAQAAFANAAVAYEATWGFGPFTNSPVGVRTVATLYPLNLHVVVRADSEIKTFSDLRGKRVSTGAKGSGSEQIAFRLFESVGLKREADLSVQSLGLGESIAALREKRIEAFIFGSAAPVEAIAKLALALPIRLLETASKVDDMNRRHGRLYADGAIAAGTYIGQTAEVATLDVWDLLVVNEKMSVDEAYRIAKAVDTHRASLASVLPNVGKITVKQQAEITPIALHLGAQLYLAEKGIAPFNRIYRFADTQATSEKSRRGAVAQP